MIGGVTATEDIAVACTVLVHYCINVLSKNRA